MTPGSILSITNKCLSQRKAEITENIKHVWLLILATKFLAKQGLTFRGDDERPNWDQNRNFDKVFELMDPQLWKSLAIAISRNSKIRSLKALLFQSESLSLSQLAFFSHFLLMSTKMYRKRPVKFYHAHNHDRWLGVGKTTWSPPYGKPRYQLINRSHQWAGSSDQMELWSISWYRVMMEFRWCVVYSIEYKPKSGSCMHQQQSTSIATYIGWIWSWSSQSTETNKFLNFVAWCSHFTCF